jgi:PAS domain S-box-containing protein
MQYKLNPLSQEQLLRLARERLVVPSAQVAATLNAGEVQRLLEDLAVHRIELEIQNEYLQETYARVQMELGRASDLHDFAPVGCVSTNLQGLLTSSNLMAASMLGQERSSLAGRLFESFFAEDQRVLIRDHMAQALETGESQRFELTLLRPNAQCQYVQVDLCALTKGEGCQIVLSDTTTRKSIETQLREDAERYEFALHAASDCLWDWNIRLGTIRYSPQITQLYGYEVGELGVSIETWRGLVHPDNHACFIKNVQECLSKQRGSLNCELRVLCKDGSYKWILCRGSVYSHTPDGRVERLIGTHTDITEYK